MEREFWTANFNSDIGVHDSEFIFMAGWIAFKLDDVESTIMKRPNNMVQHNGNNITYGNKNMVQHNF